ncbi:MAG: NAD(P)H-hydrate dehydratase, partial [Oligoflexia bacterium]|nr:NAD(P)H-hydrate dehydratase [Oligoflexia bacterium]
YAGEQIKGALWVLEGGFPPSLLQRRGGECSHEAEDRTAGMSWMVVQKQFAKKQGSFLRPSESKWLHKNDFGHVLLIGGSPGCSGALALASMAALRVGAGLVTAMTHEHNYQELTAKIIPEIMTAVIPESENERTYWLNDLNQRYQAIVIGPGLGRGESTRRLVVEILSHYSGPAVIDADAVSVLRWADDSRLFTQRGALTLLTPHPGEWSTFTGVEKKILLDDPLSTLAVITESKGMAVLLKGPCTLVAHANGAVYFHDWPNDGMATAGSGDVLAGILVGLLGQNRALHRRERRQNNILKGEMIPECDLINLAISLHSFAGWLACEEQGAAFMSASSIINNLLNN